MYFDCIPLEECNGNDLVENSLKAKVVEYRDNILELAVGIYMNILIQYIKLNEHGMDALNCLL